MEISCQVSFPDSSQALRVKVVRPIHRIRLSNKSLLEASGPFFLRKLKSAETPDDLERVMQTLRWASDNGMIELSRFPLRSGEYDLAPSDFDATKSEMSDLEN